MAHQTIQVVDTQRHIKRTQIILELIRTRPDARGDELVRTARQVEEYINEPHT